MKIYNDKGLTWTRLPGRAAIIVLLVCMMTQSLPLSPARAAVPAPTLISPAYGAHTTGNPEDPEPGRELYEPLGLPTFLWQPVPGVSKYYLQVSTISDFSGFLAVDKKDLVYAGYTPIHDDWRKDTFFNVQHPLENQLYYWRVGSYDSSTQSWQWSSTWSFTRHWGKSPLPVSPPNAGPNEFLEFNPVFEWMAVPGASFYEIQVSTSTAFGTSYTAFTRQTTFATTGLAPLSNDTDYYWRVRAYAFANNALNANGGASGDWSCTAGVTTDCPRFRIRWSYYQADTELDRRPVPLTPVNNATNVGMPLFSWTPVEGAARYELQVCPDPGCTEGLQKVKLSGGDATPNTFWNYKLAQNWDLKPNSTYYWRVRACMVECKTGYYGQWTSETPNLTFQFTTGSYTPTIPSLFYPPYYYDPSINQGNFEDRTVAVPTFMWDHEYNATEYILQVTDPVVDPNFLNPLWVVHTHNTSAVPTTSVPITQGIFVWRVSGDNGATWSQDWKARIDVTRLGGSTPFSQPPQLLRPDYRPAPDGNTYGYDSVDAFPLLEWMPVQDATSYHVQIARDPNFEEVVDETDTLFTNYTPLDYCPPTFGALGDCQLGWGTYYWRVRAYNVGSAQFGAYSTPYRFMVSAPLRMVFDQPSGQVKPLPAKALLATDSMSDAPDSTLEVGDLYFASDKDNLLISFGAQPGSTAVTYVILMDTNHADGVGASSPPGMSGITAALPHRPDYAIVATFNNATTVFTPTLYAWLPASSSWDAGRLFSFLNSKAYYDSAVQLAELRLARTTVLNPASIAFSVFTSSGGAVADAVPDALPGDPNTYLSQFVAHSQAPAPVLPPAQVVEGNHVMRQTPLMMWRTMDDVWSASGPTRLGTYRGRVATDYGFSNIYKPKNILQEGWTPNIMPFSYSNSYYIPHMDTFEDNPLYYWDVSANVRAIQLPYSQPFVFSKSMFSPVDPIVTPLVVSGTISYTAQTPTLSWTSAQGSKGYLLTVKEGGTTVVKDFPLYTFNTTHAPLNTLKEGFYTWQVQTADGDDYLSADVSGSASSFTIVYPLVRPVSPLRGGSITNPFVFKWARSEGAAYYELQVDLTDQFSPGPNLNTYKTFNTTYIPPVKPTALTKGNLFYWRVRQCKGDGASCGAWTTQIFGYEVFLPVLLRNL